MQNSHASGTQNYYNANWNNLKAQVWSPITTCGLETWGLFSKEKVNKEVDK